MEKKKEEKKGHAIFFIQYQLFNSSFSIADKIVLLLIFLLQTPYGSCL